MPRAPGIERLLLIKPYVLDQYRSHETTGELPRCLTMR